MVEKTTTLKDCLAPVIQAMGFEFVGCELQGGILRVYIDSVTGVSVDACSRVSRQVSTMLDVIDPIPGRYSLEISSPGLNRPLFELDHYQKQIGQRIKIKTKAPIDKQRKFIGTLLNIEQNNVHLLVDDKEVVLPFSAIEKANVMADVRTK